MNGSTIAGIAAAASSLAAMVGAYLLHDFHLNKVEKIISSKVDEALQEVDRIYEEVIKKVDAGEYHRYPRMSKDAHLVVDDHTPDSDVRKICRDDIYAQKCAAETSLRDVLIAGHTGKLSADSAEYLISCAVGRFKDNNT